MRNVFGKRVTYSELTGTGSATSHCEAARARQEQTLTLASFLTFGDRLLLLFCDRRLRDAEELSHPLVEFLAGLWAFRVFRLQGMLLHELFRQRRKDQISVAEELCFYLHQSVKSPAS